MSVSVAEDGTIMLQGVCPADDAEALLRLLLINPAAAVDWRACDQLHAAVVQVLLAAQPMMHGPPRSTFLAGWIKPDLSPNAI